MHIIANPATRRGNGEKTTRLITRALEKKGIAYTLEYTIRRGDAAEIARTAAASGTDMVLCIGGDGTVSEIAAGLAGSDTVLGIIPAGTGNDFAKYLRIPRKPLDALEVALSSAVCTVDAGIANERYFINVAGSGFDVAVLNSTLRYKKIFGGLFAYVLGVLTALFTYRPIELTIKAGNNTINKRSLLVVVANGKYIGGGMCAAPDALADDGLFDVLVIDALPRWKVPVLLSKFISGNHTKWSMVHSFRCAELEITASDGSLQLDGEIFSEQSVSYKIIPQALKVKIPFP